MSSVIDKPVKPPQYQLLSCFKFNSRVMIFYWKLPCVQRTLFPIKRILCKNFTKISFHFFPTSLPTHLFIIFSLQVNYLDVEWTLTLKSVLIIGMRVAKKRTFESVFQRLSACQRGENLRESSWAAKNMRNRSFCVMNIWWEYLELLSICII
jgi:hypothetical protein